MKMMFKNAPVKTTLLASALSLGVIAGATVPTLITGQPQANAEAVKVTTPAAPVDFSNVVKAVKPAVVSVQVKTQISRPDGNKFGIPGFPEFRDLPKDHPFNRFFRRFGEDKDGDSPKKAPRPRYGQSQGSGFFISEDGLVVTNHHVIDKGSEFTLVMDDGTELEAELLGSDERSDLALLKVKKPDRKYQYVKFAKDLHLLARGFWPLAIRSALVAQSLPVLFLRMDATSMLAIMKASSRSTLRLTRAIPVAQPSTCRAK